MTKNKPQKPFEHVEIDGHRLDPQYVFFEVSIRRLPNTVGRWPGKRPVIETCFDLSRKCVQMPDNEGED